MKNAVEVLIDRDRLKAQMALTGHATAKEFVSEAIELYTTIAEDLLISGKVPGFVDEATRQGTSYDAAGLFHIEAARQGNPQTAPVRGRDLSTKGLTTRVQVWLENEEQCSYVKSRTGHASYNDFASEAVGLYMEMVDSIAQGKMVASIDEANGAYNAYSTPGLYHAALEMSGNGKLLQAQVDAPAPAPPGAG